MHLSPALRGGAGVCVSGGSVGARALRPTTLLSAPRGRTSSLAAEGLAPGMHVPRPQNNGLLPQAPGMTLSSIASDLKSYGKL